MLEQERKVSNLTSSDFWRRHSDTDLSRCRSILRETEIQEQVTQMHRLLTGAEVFDITQEDA